MKLGTVERDLRSRDGMPSTPITAKHIDISDRIAREAWMAHFGVTEERLRKAVRMVSSRATTVAAYLGQPRS